MRCPFYSSESMCEACNRGLYVPPKEIELEFCKGLYNYCPKYREATTRLNTEKTDVETLGEEGVKAREPP